MDEKAIFINNLKFTKSLDENIKLMQNLFKDDNTCVTRIVTNRNSQNIRCAIFFLDGMVNNAVINESVVKPISLLKCDGPLSIETLCKCIVQVNDSRVLNTLEDVLPALLYGDTIILLDGEDRAIGTNTKGFSVRAGAEPENEKVIQGPREGFTEAFMINLSMIRRRIKNPNLKFSFTSVGSITKTTAVLCYIDGVCDKKVLSKVEARLAKFDLDSALDSNYIIECIKDHKYTPFNTIGITERPDIISAKLLEGRVAVIIDGTPVALTTPHIFLENFQSNDDYYINFMYANITRVLRILAFILTISIPAIYLALITYHQEMIPTNLLFSIAAARSGVPFPSLLEAIVLLVVFEILKEAGTRTPSSIGQTLSIVGALVLGQSAVEAKFVSAPMVIVIAFAGITALVVPKLRTPSILLRFSFLILSSILGLYGYIFGVAIVLFHICSLETFGVSYMSNIVPNKDESREDVFLRFPWFKMKKQERFLAGEETEKL